MTASQSALQSIPLPDGPYLSIGLEAQYSQAQAENEMKFDTTEPAQNVFNFVPGGAIRENDPQPTPFHADRVNAAGSGGPSLSVGLGVGEPQGHADPESSRPSSGRARPIRTPCCSITTATSRCRRIGCRAPLLAVK
jgi:hypothetical protein